MNTKRKFTGYSKGLALGVSAIVLTATVSVAAVQPVAAYDEPHGTYMIEKDIVATAADAGGFETLLTAARKAGLADTLASGGPFTVFAPTDEAFAAIPEAKLKALLNDKAALAEVLTYHVVPGRITARDARLLGTVQTVQGQTLTLAYLGGLSVDGANVIDGDLMATNGVIHAIDRVMLPK